MMYLDTYIIIFNTLIYAHSVKGNTRDAEGMGAISSSVINLSPGYTDPFGLAELIRIGWIQIFLLFTLCKFK